ncbi:MAG: DUF92 domain-containing protein [Candidatus Methanoperedens sp.]|nr:DUF92 domain-containing protein [Candidatus Methanoperedens sp.]
MMKLIQCCEKQGIFIFIGLIVLLFPFVNTYYLAAAFVGAALLFSVLSPGSPAFGFFARESDVKAGKLISLIQLFFTIAFLFIINLAVGQNKFPLFIIGAAFAITTFGDGVADAVNILEKAKETGQTHEIKYYSAKSSIVFLISGSLYAFVAGTWISGFTLKVPDGMLFFLAVIGAITGALLESMITNDDNIVIPFGSAMVMWLFYMFGYNVDTVYLMQVLVFSFVLGYLAYKARIADISAMLSATLLGVVIILSSNKGWFLFSILLAFFLLGSLFTRYKYGYKLGEIGETYKGEPRMITTFKKARPGTDGAISHLGEAAAFFGAFAIAVLAFFFIKKDITLMIAAAAGGFIGTNIDSVLGATLQQKGYLSNNGVNLFATISGAIIAGILYSSMGL